MRDELRFRHLVRHLHQLGPRPVGELVLALAQHGRIPGAVLLGMVETYANMDPAVLTAWPGGRDWLQTLAPIDGGRR